MSKAVVSESTTAPVRQLKTVAYFARRRSNDQCKRSSLLYPIENRPDTLAGVGNVLDSAKVNIQFSFDWHTRKGAEGVSEHSLKVSGNRRRGV